MGLRHVWLVSVVWAAIGCTPMLSGDYHSSASAAGLHLVLNVPTSVHAGDALPVQVQVLESDGAPSGYVGNISLTWDTNQTHIAGKASWSPQVQLTQVGNVMLTATADDLSQQAQVTVLAGAPAAVRVQASPTSASVGQMKPLVLTVVDAYGNVVDAAVTLHVTSSDSAASLPVDVTLQGSDHGTATVFVAMGTAGSQTVTATTTGTPAVQGSATLAVTLPTCQPFGFDSALTQDPNNPAVSLALDPQNLPWLAWTDDTGGVSVQQWTAQAWQRTNVQTGSAYISPTLWLAGAHPLVMFAQVTGGAGQVLAYQHAASGWLPQGLPLQQGISQTPEMRVESVQDANRGTVFVVWDDPSAKIIHLRTWDGNAWSPMGPSGQSDIVANSGSHPAVTLNDQGNPIVAWSSSNNSTGVTQIYVEVWQPNSSSWVQLGASASGGGVSNSPSSGDADYPVLAMQPGGQPAVAWQDFPNTQGFDIYFRAFDGTTWVDLDGSGSGNGLSGSARDDATHASLVYGVDGQPIVAWQQATSGADQIYLRRYDLGTKQWVEWGASASANGVSAAVSTGAAWPRLRLGSDGVPVLAWNSRSGNIWYAHVCAWK